MACACRTGTTYVITFPNGNTEERRSEVEARALAIRTGGTYRAKS